MAATALTTAFVRALELTHCYHADELRSRGLTPYVEELDEVVTAMERESGRPDGVGLDEVRAALAEDRAE